MSARIPAFAVLCFLSACGEEGGGPDSQDDPGIACFGEGLEADGSWVVTIDETCFSGSYEDVEVACEITLDGSVLTIDGEATWVAPGGDITTDCQVVTATCSLASLPDGTYEVRYGGASRSISLGGSEVSDRICLPRDGS